ncbi:MAG: outer membrane beta-barrel protein [Flavobacteriaceae bacterium]|nr:outer membrane beta-barrel protein [Flavobacteriaceae bacterium]
MKTQLKTLLFFIFIISTLNAQKDSNSKWAIQLNVINVLPNESDPIEGGSLTMSDAFGFEIGINYFFNNNISTEFTLGSSNHETKIQYSYFEQHRYIIGDVLIIPLNLNFQYHFYLNKFKSYLGAGINYTFFNVKEEELIGGVDGGEFDSTFGFVLQGGIDYEINNRWFVNFDIKQMFISTDMTIYHGWCGTPAKSQMAIPCPDYNIEDVVEKVDINPLSFGLGIGYKFN